MQMILRDDTVGISKIKKSLGKEFEVKDLSPLRYFLETEVARSLKGISLNGSMF